MSIQKCLSIIYYWLVYHQFAATEQPICSLLWRYVCVFGLVWSQVFGRLRAEAGAIVAQLILPQWRRYVAPLCVVVIYMYTPLVLAYLSILISWIGCFQRASLNDTVLPVRNGLISSYFHWEMGVQLSVHYGMSVGICVCVCVSHHSDVSCNFPLSAFFPAAGIRWRHGDWRAMAMGEKTHFWLESWRLTWSGQSWTPDDTEHPNLSLRIQICSWQNACCSK